MKDSLFRNKNKVLSGAKLILLLAITLSFAWLIRDLVFNKDLAENHVVLLSVLTVVGLFNRISARGDIRIGAGPNGVEIESTNQNKNNEF